MTEFPIIGVGASAGGLAAYDAFFRGLPTGSDPGMAFVLVQHLAPDHDSMLVELVQRCTSLKVLPIVDGLRVQSGCVYVIPPGFDLLLRHGRLQLTPPAAPRSPRMPIDIFFKSLAEDQRELAVGVVLSGTGHDGTEGLRVIRQHGGLVMVQTPASTEFDGMPRSAIAAGLADFELDPQQMGAQLVSHLQQGAAALPTQPLPAAQLAQLNQIHLLLRRHTGHDFSQYKPNTVTRRIERRMLHHQIASVEAYLHFLQGSPAELDELFADLLIGVTRFFRDAEAFQALAERFIQPLFEQRSADQPVRVWCVGCSTGEEAYSVAMLLAECAQAAASSATVQVFATDIDRRAIEVARGGVYPATIAGDLSPERLARFFVAEPGGSYRIHKRIRDRVIFSEQDVILDPPFSRLDLLVCRNVMIYLDEQLQKRLVPMFHYALKPGGALFLGSAEGIGEFADLFTPLERGAKVYRRSAQADDRRVVHPRFGLPLMPSALNGALGGARLAGRPTSLREVAERALLAHLEPVAALVNAQGDVGYLHGRSGLFLEPAQGDAQVGNILKMAREGLGPSLGATLQRVVQSGVAAGVRNLRVKTNGDYSLVDLFVRPVSPEPAAGERALFLVVLSLAATSPEPASGSGRAAHPDDAAAAPAGDAEQRIADLQAELLAKDEYLLSAHNQLQRANEELTSINEEAQSINEELQSTNEELETSKEELQSVNEELITANFELEDKISRLTQANNDMNNLLAGTGIGTLFVDHGLRVLRFTPAMNAIVNLIPEDAGRPLAHFTSNLVGYPDLLQDAQAVLDTLVPREREVQTADGRWYALRIQPYRTLENVIEGAVISFIEISDSVRTREELRRVNAHMRHAAVLRDAADAISVQALDGRILAWNPAAERLYGWTEAEALLLKAEDRIPPALRADESNQLALRSVAAPITPQRTVRLSKAGQEIAVSVVVSKLLDGAGAVYAIAATERALTDPERPDPP